MKKYLLWVVAAIAAEIVIIAIGRIAGISGATFLIAITILPVSLFAAAIYLLFRSLRSGSTEDKDKGKDAGK